MAMTATSTVEKVRQKFPQAIVETVEYRDEQTIVLKPEELVKVCSYLQKDLQYNFLSSVTAVDWPERIPRFDVVYHLLSLPNRWLGCGHQQTGMNVRCTISLVSHLPVIPICAAFSCRWIGRHTHYARIIR